MNKTKDAVFLIVAFLEWFTTLAFQMVALRKAVPYVWSSVVLTSVVIWVILLALSAGYFAWWVLTQRLQWDKLIRRLQWYLLISALYYLFIVYPSFDASLQYFLSHIGFIPTLFVFALLFFAIPTFLASHTMPVITHLSQGTKWYAAWKILFISTIWSFLGSTITTLVLFPQLWVYRTGILASIILILCAVLLHWKRFLYANVSVLSIVLISAIWLRPHVIWYYEETPYQTIAIRDGQLQNGKIVRIMQMNGGRASGIETLTKKSFFPYVRQIVDIIEKERPSRIAIIGAAWCTLPQEIALKDYIAQIDIIDIDKRVFSLAEEYFLQSPLHEKINPIWQSARGWIYDAISSQKKYDMIIVDAYNGISLPDELLTREFFAWMQQLSPKIVMNLIADKSLQSDFSTRFLQTLWDVFWDSIYMFDASSTSSTDSVWNMILTTFSTTWMKPQSLPQWLQSYTDDKNNADELRVQVMFKR